MSKLDTWWIGPTQVVQRTGELSYQVLSKPGVLHDVHHDQLKLYVEDVVEGDSVELFHHTTAYTPLATEPDEWLVDKILRHRQRPDGKWEFLTRWQHAAPGENTWEPASQFITRYCVEFPTYLKTHRLRIGAVKLFPMTRLLSEHSEGKVNPKRSCIIFFILGS